MTPEKKRKLRNIAILALLGLIGGTFAFAAFNQQAINDRLRENPAQVGGRVHDYFHRDTDNKDVFVENFGQEPIMVRLKLSEFLEYQNRGATGWTQLVNGTERTNPSGWTPYIPSGDDINQRTGDSAAFEEYSNLTFGWEGNGTAPWYLPTFNTAYTTNHELFNLTAAAGDARDYEANGTTHPGTGRADQWAAGGSFDNSNNDYPGASVTRHTAQTLPQDEAPMTLQEWATNPRAGNFWVIDHETGWAYWANQLNGGQATSYLLDAAAMLPAADEIPGSYYYAIHVESDLIAVNQSFQSEPTSGAVSDLLEEIRSPRATGNPAPTTVSHAKAFNFSRMSDTVAARHRFTLANPDGTGAQVFRYLGNMGQILGAEGSTSDHMIIRNQAFGQGTNWNNRDTVVDNWYDNNLPADLKAMVQPVANDFPTDPTAFLPWIGPNWLPSGIIDNLSNWPVVYGDRTRVVPDGVRRAVNLSIADMSELMRTTAFLNQEDRGTNISWWLRTPQTASLIWGLNNHGTWSSFHYFNTNFGVRPALIIHQ